jgi:hypothetical protein
MAGKKWLVQSCCTKGLTQIVEDIENKLLPGYVFPDSLGNCYTVLTATEGVPTILIIDYNIYKSCKECGSCPSPSPTPTRSITQTPAPTQPVSPSVSVTPSPTTYIFVSKTPSVTPSPSLCACTYRNVIINSDDINDAVRNSNPLLNNTVFIAYYDCNNNYVSKSYTSSGSYSNDICWRVSTPNPISYYFIDNNFYNIVYVFKYNNSIPSYSMTFDNDYINVDILVVGGGGGGYAGTDLVIGNGGSGGQVLHSNISISKNTNYIINVGDSGYNSSFSNIIANSGVGENTVSNPSIGKYQGLNYTTLYSIYPNSNIGYYNNENMRMSYERLLLNKINREYNIFRPITITDEYEKRYMMNGALVSLIWRNQDIPYHRLIQKMFELISCPKTYNNNYRHPIKRSWYHEELRFGQLPGLKCEPINFDIKIIY